MQRAPSPRLACDPMGLLAAVVRGRGRSEGMTATPQTAKWIGLKRAMQETAPMTANGEIDPGHARAAGAACGRTPSRGGRRRRRRRRSGRRRSRRVHPAGTRPTRRPSRSWTGPIWRSIRRFGSGCGRSGTTVSATLRSGHFDGNPTGTLLPNRLRLPQPLMFAVHRLSRWHIGSDTRFPRYWRGKVGDALHHEG